ncbi:phenylacetate--CoA ligase family protein [Capnocytophaga cynodegmi]|uniref:Coenzyme F390 synthetase-like protein n=1 Tax=Capnocytophaga cynodegmi TaxID=28189 RepID=A0A0B7HEA3_9FLAO|nr:phenylacetate--CoA ligase family protein [Capnocytophaga cynodegmi]CEN35913.1 Coenzyme F390 synthetase-like protein [Capnocytophaga cynodegmi]
MYLDELIRNKVFFLLDFIKGKNISKKINLLDDFYRDSKENQLHIVNNKLVNLLNDVTKNVPFYMDKGGLSDLKDFPIVNKKNIYQNTISFYSKIYNSKKLVPVRTSGSYGTPLTYFLTKKKKESQLAEVIFFGRKSGYDVGVRHGYFRSIPHKTNFKFWMQNETFFASKQLNEEFVSLGIKNLKKKRIKSLIGFPSAISYLAKSCLEKGYLPSDFKVKGVITSSENLTSHQRKTIRKAFDCAIHSRYSTEELGVLGNQLDETSGFVMNTFNYIIEVLKLDRDESADIGEIGRIVVTDLHSNSMPLIRYETGDLGKIGNFFCNEKKWVGNISMLSGRAVQIIYSTNGTPLYPLFLDSIMEKYDYFSQYQLIQNDKKDFTIKLVTNNYCSEDQFDINKFLNYFYNWLGNDANVTVDFVKDIDKLPSGKRPYIINRYKEFAP